MASQPAVIDAPGPIPPRWAKLCLWLVASAAACEDRCGDLDEEYHDTLLLIGPEQAARDYVANVMGCIAAILRHRLRVLTSPQPDDIAKFQIFTIAAIVAVGLVNGIVREATKNVWWVSNGFGKSPGYFLHMNAVDYPVCAPWGDESGTDRAIPEQDREETSIAIFRGSESNASVLLPRHAKVVRIYCGVARGAQPPTPCSTTQCPSAMSPFVTDDEYTEGRALTLTFADPLSINGSKIGGIAWVVWKN